MANHINCFQISQRYVAVLAITGIGILNGCGGGGAGGGAPPAAGNVPGDFVAFQSAATNLVSGDTNIRPDIFVHDRSTGTTTRVSVDSAGGEGNSDSLEPALSADGRFVAFESFATNLVADDTNGVRDIFVHDRSTGATTRCCPSGKGAGLGNGDSANGVLSGDGSILAFESVATNFVPVDTNSARDIFVNDSTTGTITRVSVDNMGGEGNGNSFAPALSADGRFVFFQSNSSNLVDGDTNGAQDIFRYDRLGRNIGRFSIPTNAAFPAPSQANGGSIQPAVPADGNCFVAFESTASNLDVDRDIDTNNATDIFVHDSCLGITTRVSKDSTGGEANGNSGRAAFSADGRFVAFESFATNLVVGDTNGVADIFVHDRSTGATARVSVDSAGGEGDGNSLVAAISADGRFVSFNSSATNLVAGDTNGVADIFVHDRSTGTTSRVSVDSAGGEGNNGSILAAIR